MTASLPPRSIQRTHDGGGAGGFGSPVTADRHPALPKMASLREHRRRTSKAFKIRVFTDDDWSVVDEEFSRFLTANEACPNGCLQRNAAAYFLNKIAEGIRASLGKRNSRRKFPLISDADPFQSCCRKRLGGPDYPIPIESHVDGNDLNDMTRRGWRAYLSRVRPSCVSALFAYLARPEGRRPEAEHYSGAMPLRDLAGDLRLTATETCTLLADVF